MPRDVDPKKALKLDEVEKMLNNIADISFDEMVGWIDKLSARIPQLKKQVDELGKAKESLQKKGKALSKEEADSLKKITAEYDKLASELKVVEPALSGVYDTMSDGTSSVKNLTKSMITLTKALDPKAWEKLKKQSGVNNEEMKKLRKTYEESRSKISANNKALLQLQLTQATTGKLTKEQIDDAMSLSKNNAKLESTIKAISEASGQAAESMDDFDRAMDEAVSTSTLFMSKIKEGRSEFENFSGGLGKSAVGVAALGASLAYGATKLKELADELKNIQKDWAQYNAITAITAKTLPVGTATAASLDQLRKDLRLTRDEALSFQGVLKASSASGVVSINELVTAAKKLEETFGEAPIDRLTEYVNLLKEIPTLDTDLNITASLDDQAATWFALAEQGKVQQVIELQMAGLAGGDDAAPPEGTEAEVETLKILRESNQIQENMEKLLASYVPQSLSLLGQMSSVGLSMLSAVGGIITITGAAQGMLGRIFQVNKAGPALDESESKLGRIADATEDFAIASNSSGGGGKTRGRRTASSIKDRFKGDSGGSASKELKGFRGALQKATGSIRKSIGGVGKHLGNFGGKIGGYAKGIGGAIKGLPGAGKVAGFAAKSLGVLGKAGGFASSSLTGLAAPAGAVLGVFAAAVGPFVLIGKYGEAAGNALKDFGDSLQGYDGVLGGVVGWFGSLASTVGGWISNAGKVWSGLWKGAKNWLIGSNDSQKAMQATAAARRAEINIINKELKIRQQSALALQEHIQGIKASTSTMKVALSDLSKEVGSLELEELGTLGGTAGEFEDALGQMAGGIKSRYALISKSLEKRRSEILRDTKLLAEDRRNALLYLHKQELDAAKVFVEGLLSIPDQLDKIPGVIESELKMAIRDARIDVSMDVGGGFGDSLFSDLTAQVTDAFSVLTSTVEQVASTTAAVDGGLDEMQGKFHDSAKEFGDVVNGTVTSLSKSRTGVIKSLQDSAKDIGEGTADEIRSKMSGLSKDIQKEITTIGEEQAKITTSLKGGMFDIKAFNDASKALLDQEAAMLGLKTQITTSAKLYKEAAGEQDELPKTVAQMNEATEVAFRKMKETESSYDDGIKQVMKLKGVAVKQEKELLDWSKKNQDVIMKELNIKKGTVLSEKKLLESGRKVVGIFNERNNTLTREITSLEDAKSKAEKMSVLSKRENASLETRKKTTEKVLNATKTILTNLNRLNDILEGDRTVQSLDRQAQVAEAKAAYESKLGNAASSLVVSQEKRTSQAKRQLSLANELIGYLKGLSDKDLGKAYDGIAKATGETVANMKKKFGEFKNLKGINKEPLEAAERAGDALVKSQMKYKEIALKAADNPESEELKSELENAGKDVAAAEKGAAETLKKAGTAITNAGGTWSADSVVADTKMLTTALGAMDGGIDKAVNGLVVKTYELKKSIVDAMNGFNDAIGMMDDSVIIQSTQAQLDYADALAQSAADTMDGASAQKALQVGLEAAGRQTEHYQKQIANLSKSEEQLAKDLANLPKGSKEATIAANKLIEVRARKEGMMFEKENKHREMIFNAIEKAGSAEIQKLDLADEQLSIQKDLAESTGANYDIIRSIQVEEISNARRRADALKDMLDAVPESQKNTVQYEKMRLEYVKAEADITKKAMGAQRDAFDKLLEKSFGAIRSSRGARKGLMSKAQTFGPGYAQDASGMVIGGKSKTLAEGRLALSGGGGGRKSPEQMQNKILSKQDKVADKQGKAAEDLQAAAQAIQQSASGYSGNAQRVLGQKTNVVPGRALESKLQSEMGKKKATEAKKDIAETKKVNKRVRKFKTDAARKEYEAKKKKSAEEMKVRQAARDTERGGSRYGKVIKSKSKEEREEAKKRSAEEMKKRRAKRNMEIKNKIGPDGKRVVSKEEELAKEKLAAKENEKKMVVAAAPPPQKPKTAEEENVEKDLAARKKTKAGYEEKSKKLREDVSGLEEFAKSELKTANEKLAVLQEKKESHERELENEKENLAYLKKELRGGGYSEKETAKMTNDADSSREEVFALDLAIQRDNEEIAKQRKISDSSKKTINYAKGKMNESENAQAMAAVQDEGINRLTAKKAELLAERGGGVVPSAPMLATTTATPPAVATTTAATIGAASKGVETVSAPGVRQPTSTPSGKSESTTNKELVQVAREKTAAIESVESATKGEKMAETTTKVELTGSTSATIKVELNSEYFKKTITDLVLKIIAEPTATAKLSTKFVTGGKPV